MKELLIKYLPAERLVFDAPMSRYTTFRVGGNADALFFPKDESELALAFKIAKENGIPVTVIGNGSNMLVKDGGIAGLVIRLGDEFSGITVTGTRITALAGDSLTRVAMKAYENGLTGFEFASGIPGSVGGGMAMNAGAYGGELKNVTVSARLMDPETGVVTEYSVDELQMGYRTTLALTKGLIVTEAVFELTAGDKETIKATMDELNKRRRDKQPLTYPSAGSTFKRPEGHFAGALIEGAGLKGLTVGGAQVSEKHAGFIINTGSATAKDILNLIDLVKQRVFENSGVTLEPEVRILGRD